MNIFPWKLPNKGYVYCDCRHFHRKLFERYLRRRQFRAFCTHLRSEISDCEGCNICPQCGSRTYTETCVAEHAREGELELTARICPICSKQTPGIKTLRRGEPITEQGTDHMAPPCEVANCKGRSWEKFRHGVHYICSKHRDMVQLWKRKGLGDDRYPLLELDGQLCENPKYRQKTTPGPGRSEDERKLL